MNPDEWFKKDARLSAKISDLKEQLRKAEQELINHRKKGFSIEV